MPRPFIERSRDARDERQVRIALTEAGRALAARAAHIPACFLEMTGLPVADLVTLRDRVIALRDRLRQGAQA